MLNKSLRYALLLGLSTTMLGACSTLDRLSNVGQPPEFTEIKNEQLERDYKPVSLPMPTPELVTHTQNSLWPSNRRTFFQDQRAKDIGDILTVVIDIDDEADLTNATERSRSGSEDAGLDRFLGGETALAEVLSENVLNTDLVDFDSNSTSNGEGTIAREEEITLRLAALVTQILPNGNFVIQGRQEVRVNFEKRVLEIMGVIRPEDITVENAIAYDKIAEARISYGGEGHLSEVQKPRYGQEVYDILFPF